MLLSLLLLFAGTTTWSAEIEEVEYSGLDKIVYLLYKGRGKEILHVIVTRSIVLHDMYLCSHEFRKNHHPSSSQLDFETLVKAYAKCYYQFFRGKGVEPDWIELYGNKEELKPQKFSGLRVHLKMNDVTFSNNNVMPEKVDLSLRKVMDNSQSDTSWDTGVGHEVSRKISVSTYSTHSWSYSESIEIGGQDPITGNGASVKLGMFVSGSESKTNGSGFSVTYNLKDGIEVPGHKTTRVIWTKSETDIQSSWSAYIEVSGWIAVKSGPEILFFPVADMAYVFSEYVALLGANKVGLKVSGNIKMADAIISQAVVDEYGVSIKASNCPNELTNFTLHKSLISEN